MTDEIIFDKLLPEIERRIKLHHELYTTAVKAENWEEILHNSINKIFGEGQSDWDPGSHKVGADVGTHILGRISCKSGVISKTKKAPEKVTISGSRTTSHKTLEDKISHLSQSHDDLYCCLSKVKDTKSSKGVYTAGFKHDALNGSFNYRLLVFSSATIRPSNLANWRQDPKNSKNYLAEGEGITQSITESMSAQLWTDLDTDKILYDFPINISND
jgi:hypothetical protein